MPDDNISSTRHFSCPPRAVWNVLVAPDLYESWYGAPLGFPGSELLSLGAKIRFAPPLDTCVVTEFEPCLRFALTSDNGAERFTLIETDSGCVVTLAVTGGFGGDRASLADEQLKKLEQTALKDAGRSRNQKRAGQKSNRFNDILSGVLQGYRTPIEHRAGALAESDELSSAIDISESDVRIHMRAMLAAAICVVLLFSTLAFTARFERGDIVPSSGLSLKQSDDVNKENAARIEMGQNQGSLELMINCMGERLSPTEFYYCSIDQADSGRPLYEMVVTYNAYGRVRNVVFIDNSMAQKAFPFPFLDLQPYLDSAMSPLDLEAVLDGYPLSGFWMDLSGVTTVYFGSFHGTVADFSPIVTAQLVIRLDAADKKADYDYYMAYDAGNPLSSNTLTRALRFQYAYAEIFVADRGAYERALMLEGMLQHDANIVLHKGAVEELDHGYGDVQYLYLLPDPWDDTAAARYSYTLSVNAGNAITQIDYINRYLLDRRDTLQALDDYTMETGMTLNEIYAEMGILPTQMQMDESTLTLCYGPRINNRQNIRQAYAVVIVLDRAERTVTRVILND